MDREALKALSEEYGSPEEISIALETDESVRFSLPESIIFLLLAGFADLLEILTAIAVTGSSGAAFPLWLMSFIFGWLVAAAIFMWLLLKGARGRFFSKVIGRRLAIFIVAKFLDTLTAGAAPAMTIGLLLVIVLNNHLSAKHLEQLDAIAKNFNKYYNSKKLS